ncbi:class III lanthipeptide [Streptomyces flavofungini]|uniref:Class III lanthipeptide n=1 Tax=Streptomyces flavofungini TaxID=68200 RepID=A0ABS0XIH1_9ACTN|nr:class III lanthipeptide [Streptomyces flavofungini]
MLNVLALQELAAETGADALVSTISIGGCH